jgi:hypothetical protein
MASRSLVREPVGRNAYKMLCEHSIQSSSFASIATYSFESGTPLASFSSDIRTVRLLYFFVHYFPHSEHGRQSSTLSSTGAAAAPCRLWNMSSALICSNSSQTATLRGRSARHVRGDVGLVVEPEPAGDAVYADGFAFDEAGEEEHLS